MFKLVKGWPGVPDPSLPPNDLQGEVPARALKYCEPFLVANAAGLLLFPPIDFSLVWTGGEVLAELEGVEERILVDRLFLPDFADYWTLNVPPEARNVMPPFMEAFPERGALQIWSGMFVATEPGVSTWVRGPVNRSSGTAYTVTEGVIDTDWWTGPLFFVLQVLKTDFPVAFRKSEPFLQVLPVRRDLLRCDEVDAGAATIEEASPAFWSSLTATAARRNGESPGSYRRQARNIQRGRGKHVSSD